LLKLVREREREREREISDPKERTSENEKRGK
jgi:hypothetical protein